MDQQQADALLAEAKQRCNNTSCPPIKTSLLGRITKRSSTRGRQWRRQSAQWRGLFNRLSTQTTTDLTVEEIHQIGLDEVARIRKEMLGIMTEAEIGW